MRVKTRTPSAAWLAAIGGAASISAGDPQPNTTTATGQTLQRIDATHADVGPLRTSTLELTPDLRVPLNFDEVYRVPGGIDPRTGQPMQDRVSRMSGGLTAVFPRSQYQPMNNQSTGKQGIQAMVPAGTVYYIGNGPGSGGSQDSTSPQRTGGMVDLFVTDTRIGTMVQAIGPQGTEQAYSQSGSEGTRPSHRPDRSVAIVPAIPPLGKGADPIAAGSAYGSARRVRPEAPQPVSVMTSETFRRSRVRELIQQAAAATPVNPDQSGATTEPTRRESAVPGTDSAGDR